MGNNQDSNKIPFLIDNRGGHTLQKVFERLEDEIIEELQIAVGYFHVSGFNLIKKYLNNVQKISLIIGNETDSATVNQLNKGHREIISDKIADDIDGISNEEDISTLHELYEYIQSGIIDVRVYVKTKFHAKAYIFKNDGPYPNTVVIGSSNLSMRGLGNNDDSNTELNVRTESSPAIEAVEEWFNEIWEESEHYRDDLMKIIQNSAHMIRKTTNDCEFVSPKNLFRTIACEYNDFRMPTGNVLTEYQQAGVITAQNAINRYGGCMISDSVGLGKTFIGISLIEIAQNKGSNVLVLVPKALKTNWYSEINRYFPNVKISDPRFKIMTITELSNLDLRNENDKHELDVIKNTYNFIVIDEAHRFRTHGEFNNDNDEYSGTKRYANLRYLKRDITKYALLSATPINNSVMDLYRLISIFTDTARLRNQDHDVTLEDFNDYQKITKSITSLKNEIKSKESERTEETINAEIVQKMSVKNTKLEKINVIINEVMVLRTRQNIVKDYANTSINGMPIVTEIPKVKKMDYEPGNSYTELYKDVQDLIISLKIPHITMIKYQSAAMNLSGLFRILLFKRLESSIHAFMISINRLLTKEKIFKQSVENNGLAETILKSDDDDHLKDDIELTNFMEEVGTQDENIEESSDEVAINNANHDIKKIEKFKAKYTGSILLDNERYFDPKLKKLEEIISDMPWKKILIFTQYADTAEYLYYNLSKFASDNNIVLDCIMGDQERNAGNKTIDQIAKIERFAPTANRAMVEPKDEIGILIATDTLSEGVNLQDCSVIINYDLPWNPMRMVQRVGRVDRIGSTSRTTVYNIIPNKELEAFLSLLENLESKIDNITSIVGKESYILSEDEELDPKTIGKRLKEARMSTKYNRYEDLSNSEINLQINDAYSQNILLLRKKMTNLNMVCVDNSLKIKNPYSIINDNYESYSFVVFKVYDAQTKEKMKNIIVVKEDDELHTIEVNDAKILRLPHISNGIPKHKTDSQKFDQDIDEIVEYFKRIELDKIRKNTNLVTKSDPKVQSEVTLSTVLGKLRQITNATQTTLTGDIGSDDVRIANQCIEKLSSNKLNSQDMTRLKKWYGTEDININLRKIGYKEFVKKTDVFVQKYMTKTRGYTPPKSKEDIQYSIVCRGASI